MGGIRDGVPIPHSMAVHRNLMLKGKWMFEREDIKGMIKMVENAVLKLGESAGLRTVDRFGLEDCDNASTTTKKNAGTGESTLILPCSALGRRQSFEPLNCLGRGRESASAPCFIHYYTESQV